MKAIKTLNAVLAASLLTGATLAQAASYEITGTLDSFSTNPAIISAIFNPTAPAFTGTWDVTTSALSGGASFSAYAVEWSVFGSPTGTTTYTSDNYSLASTTSTYDAGTRTLTVTGTVSNTSASYTCSGAAFFCGDTLPAYDLSLTLTFTDDTLKAFSGSLAATNDDGEGSQYSYAWSFNGQTPEVPVPAAFWLFGSGLAGLAGFARSRKS
jgi:hypothetical protein